MIRLLVVLMLVASVGFAKTLSEYGYNIDLIANKQDSVSVTLEELRFIYTGRITIWQDGTRIKLYIKDLHNYCQRRFILEMLGISMAKFRESINRYDHIAIEENKSSIISRLRSNIGSIGIVNKQEVYLSTDQGLVVVKVEE